MACFIANKIHQRKQTMRLAKVLKKLNAARANMENLETKFRSRKWYIKASLKISVPYLF